MAWSVPQKRITNGRVRRIEYFFPEFSQGFPAVGLIQPAYDTFHDLIALSTGKHCAGFAYKRLDLRCGKGSITHYSGVPQKLVKLSCAYDVLQHSIVDTAKSIQPPVAVVRCAVVDGYVIRQAVGVCVEIGKHVGFRLVRSSCQYILNETLLHFIIVSGFKHCFDYVPHEAFHVCNGRTAIDAYSLALVVYLRGMACCTRQADIILSLVWIPDKTDG